MTSPSGEALETLSPRENRPQSRTIQAVASAEGPCLDNTHRSFDSDACLTQDLHKQDWTVLD